MPAEEKTLCSINLPIMAKDVFRVLALKSIADARSSSNRNESLLSILNEDKTFEAFEKGITTTERLDWDSPFDYEHAGLKKDRKWKTHADMTERELCASPKGFFGRKFCDSIGQVVDYEVPLDEKRDAARGKVDLISIKDDVVYLLEVKKCDSDELPIRAFFEIYTFWKTLQDDPEKEAEGFQKFLKKYVKGKQSENPIVKKVIPGLLLCQQGGCRDGILNRLRNCHEEAEKGLYRKFMNKGVRVFSYTVGPDVDAEIKVNDVTEELRGKYCC